MLYDISVPLTSAFPVWPGDPAIQVERRSRMEEGGYCNVSHVSVGTHGGTHMDAPFHFVPDGKRLWELPLDRLIGPCWVADCRGARLVTAAQLDAAGISADVTRLLLRTDNSEWWAEPNYEFHRDFVALSGDGAQWVVERGIQLVGIDYMSIDAFDAEGSPAHHILLPNEVIVVENLDLRTVPLNRAYDLLCLPLSLAAGGDGAPVRAILKAE